MLQAVPWFTVSVAGVRTKCIRYVAFAFLFSVLFLPYFPLPYLYSYVNAEASGACP